MKSLYLAAGAALMMVATPLMAQDAQPAAATQPAGPVADLVTTAKSQGQFTTLSRAIEAAGMEEQLKGGDFVTFFAPTDAAFAKLPAEQVEQLLQPQNREQLRTLLANHLVPGNATAEFLGQQKNAAMNTIGGGQVTIDNDNGAVLVSGARVVAADLQATNGIIQGIDTVLMPAPEQQAQAAPAEAAQGSEASSEATPADPEPKLAAN